MFNRVLHRRRRPGTVGTAWLHGVFRDRPWLACALVLVCLLPAPGPAMAGDVRVQVNGINGPLAKNVESHVLARWMPASAMSTGSRRERFVRDAVGRAELALRPFGYYAPRIAGRLDPQDGDNWLLVLDVQAGPPMLVEDVHLDVEGPGRDLTALREWVRNWPLQPGVRLDQTLWEDLKTDGLERAGGQGYLSAAYATQRIEVDLERHRARLELVLDTGPQALMGGIHHDQQMVRPWVLAPVPRFQAGDPYQRQVVEQFRTDLWRTGYFGEVDVVEEHHLDVEPARVDFRVSTEGRNRDTHQATVGYGTDTDFRTQYRWDRHLLSSRGDSFFAGLGWKQRDEQLLLFGEYRLPRRSATLQYWSVSSLLKKESETLRLTDNTGDVVGIARGRVDNGSVRFGRARLHALWGRSERLVANLFAEHLRENNHFNEIDALTDLDMPDFPAGSGDELFPDSVRSLAFGVDLDWPAIQGKGFRMTGHHERAWIFTASESLGSEVDFTQAYASTRWNFMLHDRVKLLVRAEAGYTDADLRDVVVDTGNANLDLSVTELPFRYRFKAGGSRSVRGYGFEELNDNGVGSNHLLAASVELEYNFHGDWSAAVFMDAGNAFNHWSQRDIRHGAGVGLRWYTLAGAVRVDIAQGLDKPGRPWELYLSIGTPLL